MSQTLTHPQNIEHVVRKQRAQATISSLLISILAIILVFLLLAFVLIPSLNLSQPDVVAYQASSVEKDEIVETVVNTAIQRKPSAPSSSSNRVIAANTSAAVAIPIPDFKAEVPSVTFGDGDDFGAGWGSGGDGSGGGGTTFFGVTSQADRVAFVIDYSGSMRQDNRADIMKKELQKAVDDLSGGTQFQMIFFAGPVWVAGSRIMGSSNTRERNTIKSGKDTFEWVSAGGAHRFEPRGKRQKATWIDLPALGHQKKELIRDTKKIIRETPLVYGTRWKYALEMALEMEPAPQVIYFMTDGATGKEAMKVARSVGEQAKAKGITVNTVAMMEPRANEAMLEMAKLSGGTFTIVEENNRRRVVKKLK